MAKKKSSKSFDGAATQSAAAPAVQARRRFGAWDFIVLCAMAVVAAACGLAFHLQAGFKIPAAAELAGGLFLLLAFMHVQRLRIEGLRAAERQAAEPGQAAGPEPALREPSLDGTSYEDGAMDLAASNLAAVAAALRNGESSAGGLAPGAQQQGAAAGPPVPPSLTPAPQADAGPSLSWGEADAVDALVRQYAKDLDRGAQAGERSEPSFEARVTEESPLTAAIRKAADGDVEIHLQPVVSFADRKARMYEVFPRIVGAEGEIYAPADYQTQAEALGLSLRVERAVLLRCCAIQRKLSERGKAKAMIFRLSGAAIRDRAFLQRVLADIRPDPMLASLILLEVDQLDIEQGGGAEHDNMELLASAGFRFSLGRAETLALEVAELTARRIAYVRVTPAILAAEQNPVAVSDLRNGGIETILTGIEQDEEVRAGRAYGLVLGQGKLFSEPKPLRADVVAAAPVPGQGSATPVPRTGKTRAA